MKIYNKHDFPTAKIRQLLEPGPTVLVTSAWNDEVNVMTLGWHMVMEFNPSLIACLISSGNHSFELIRRSRECAINVPTVELKNEVVAIGNCTGLEVDKFAAFNLTAEPATFIDAPLIAECYANLECRLVDSHLVKKYNVFIFEVVSARVATSPEYPKTLHYYGEGIFMVAGETLDLRPLFRPEMLY